MVQVHRSGSIVSIPRKLSHHVPVVPIIDCQDHEFKITTHWADIDSEEYQLYKTASCEEYSLVERAHWEIVGKQKFPIRNKSQQLSAVELKVLEILHGEVATSDEILKILEEILTEENVKEMNEMIEHSNLSLDDVVKHFMKRGQLRNLSVGDKLKQLIGEKNLTDSEMIQLLRSQLGPRCQEMLEQMLRSGVDIQDIVQHFMKSGKTRDEENEELERKMKKIVDNGVNNMSAEELLATLESDLTEAEMKKLKELMKKGCSAQVMD